MAGIAVGVHGQVADFAGIARRPAKRASPDDETGTDAALAPEADEIVRAAAGTTQVLSGGGQIGVVAHEHRHIQIAKSLADQVAHRHVPPAEIGSVVEEAILGTNRPRHGDADGDYSRATGHGVKQRLDHPVELVHDLDRI